MSEDCPKEYISHKGGYLNREVLSHQSSVISHQSSLTHHSSLITHQSVINQTRHLRACARAWAGRGDTCDLMCFLFGDFHLWITKEKYLQREPTNAFSVGGV